MQIFCYSLVTSRVLQNMSGEIEFDEIGTVGVKKCMQIHAISTCFLVKVFFFPCYKKKGWKGKRHYLSHVWLTLGWEIGALLHPSEEVLWLLE